MQYWLLKKLVPATELGRVLRNLTMLRTQLDKEVPPKDAESELLLGTWNLRDFGKTNRRGFGDRFPESHFYIAEVLSRFDFIAVQEVNELGEWERVLDILGPSWEWIATDVTDEGLGGNGERLTYLYDTRKVDFRHIAGELVLPAKLLISASLQPKEGDEDKIEAAVEGGGEGMVVGKQFRRTPFAAIFQAAWFKFEICTVHIYYGDESGQPLRERIEEIERIAGFFGKRAEKAIAEGRSLILLGDFNIVGRDHRTMQALEASGFKVPPALREAPPTNADQD